MEEEVEGLRRKLERMEKTKEDLVKMELQKEVNTFGTTGLCEILGFQNRNSHGLFVCLFIYLFIYLFLHLFISPRDWQKNSKPGKTCNNLLVLI